MVSYGKRAAPFCVALTAVDDQAVEIRRLSLHQFRKSNDCDVGCHKGLGTSNDLGMTMITMPAPIAGLSGDSAIDVSGNQFSICDREVSVELFQPIRQ